MLDSKFIRENPDAVRGAIRDKHVALDLDVLLAADRKLLDLSRELQLLQEKRNRNAKSIPTASPSERAALIAKGRETYLNGRTTMGGQTRLVTGELS